MSKSNPSVLFLSHGGGPLPLLGDAGHQEMVQNLKQVATRFPKPSAILLVSAHWEAATPTLTAGSQPALIYDYYGFPDESYEIQYPCPGEPALARQVQQRLHDQGMPATLDEKRGFDHGLFVPLKIMYPQADIPCVQLSLLHNLDAKAHIQMGAALAGVEYDNLLVIGSGFSFHNLRAFFAPATDEIQMMNAAFEQWLIETCSSTNLDEAQRMQRLVQWQQAPYARYCHPREEHLLPLHVCYGLAQTACKEYFRLTIMNKQASVYLWQDD
jgi:4,5-DOPA dioxygenase extradiol